MTLRNKLTIGFSVFIGSILLSVGILIYGVVSVILIDHIDQRLQSASEQVIQRLYVTNANSFLTRELLNYAPREGQIFQVWKNASELVFNRPFVYNQPLDPIGLQEGQPVFRSVSINGQRLRVLSVPLTSNRGLTGVLQVGMDLDLVEVTNRTLAMVLIIMLALAVIISALITNLAVKENLKNLFDVTETIRDITEKNDLTRRLPKRLRTSPEIDQIVDSFNNTLEQLDSLLNSQKRLLTDVSHELRTPLTVIKGEVGFMRKYRKIDEDSINAIDSEVDRLTRLVGNLLMLAQAESGDLPMEYSKFGLDELVCEVFHHMKTLSGDRIKLKLNHIEQIEINGDRDRIKQVLFNLIGNAIQYTRENGEVNINLRLDKTMALISVADNGPGINKEDLENIFERFFRGEKSRTRSRNSGFGLGLSISKYIVDHHQGEIRVESEVGKGTVFQILIPVQNMMENKKPD